MSEPNEKEEPKFNPGSIEVIITLNEEGRLNLKVNGARNKILIYGMLMMAIETIMKPNQPKIQIPPMGMKFPPFNILPKS